MKHEIAREVARSFVHTLVDDYIPYVQRNNQPWGAKSRLKDNILTLVGDYIEEIADEIINTHEFRQRIKAIGEHHE